MQQEIFISLLAIIILLTFQPVAYGTERVSVSSAGVQGNEGQNHNSKLQVNNSD